MIKFRCSSCNQKLGVPEEYVGRRIRCNKCSSSSIVPSLSAGQSVGVVLGEGALADSVPLAPPVQIELQRPVPSPSIPEPEQDPNAEILRQYRRKQSLSSSAAKNITQEQSPFFQRFGSLGVILNPLIRFIGSFPLAVICSITVTAIAITVWNLIALFIGTPLEIFYAIIPVAAGIGLCIITDHRGLMMGLLSLLMGIIAIVAGRITQVHLFVLPEWHKIVTSVDVPADYEKMYRLMSQIPNKSARSQVYQNYSQDSEALTAMAICSLILEKQIAPLTGIDVYYEVHSEVEKLKPDELADAHMSFHNSALTDVWSKVTDRLREWDTPEKRTEAAGGYFTRYQFFLTQYRYKLLLDNYPVAITVNFLVCDGGCVFLFLRVCYCIIGLIGAYKTCSESFMD